MEGPHRQRQRDGRQPDRAAPRRLEGRDGDRRRGPDAANHGRRPRRDPADQGCHQQDGRPARIVRLGSDPRRQGGRHGRRARRAGGSPGCRRHVEGPDRQRERDGGQPHEPGPQHRGGDDRGGQRRPVQEDHGDGTRRDPRAEEHDQHDGRSARVVCLRSDPCGPRGGHRRQAGRPGRREGRRRHVEGPHRERQLHGQQPDQPGAQHRRRHDGRGIRRPVQEDHRRRTRRDPRAEEHDQHDGRSAQLLRGRSHPRGARGRHRRQARRPGHGPRRRRHMEGPHRQRQFHGEQPDEPGAEHRRRDHRGCQRRPLQEDHRRRPRRDPRVEKHHQYDGRSAQHVCFRSDARGARGRHRRQAWRTG